MELSTLKSLQTRIRESKGADRELDQAIDEALTSDSAQQWWPYYTADPDGLGACVGLMREVLPGCEFELSTLYGIATVALPLNAEIGPDTARREDGNLCLTFLGAICAAKIAELEARQTETAA